MIGQGLTTGFNYSGNGRASGEPNMVMHHRIWALTIRRQSGGEIAQTGWVKNLGGSRL